MFKLSSLITAPINVGPFPALPFRLEEDNTSRLWVMCSLIMVAFVFILVPAQVFDPRLFEDSPIWHKPIKFALSLAIHFFTLAILAQQISRQYRVTKTLTFFAYASVLSAMFELIYISIQAGRGRQSHFNSETGFEAAMYSLMGIGSLFLVAVSFVLGVTIWRFSRYRLTQTESIASNLSTCDANLGLRWGSIIGLTLGSILTLAFAGYMSISGSHHIGQEVGQASAVPIVGWSRTIGDLRIPHFIATHLMQILPLIGLISDTLNWRSKPVMIASTLVLTGFSVVSFLIAFAGRPLFGG
jgi:hypothetical protein